MSSFDVSQNDLLCILRASGEILKRVTGNVGETIKRMNAADGSSGSEERTQLLVEIDSLARDTGTSSLFEKGTLMWSEVAATLMVRLAVEAEFESLRDTLINKSIDERDGRGAVADVGGAQ